jgi:3-oxoacyl-[acyl-carrier protein] reductase
MDLGLTDRVALVCGSSKGLGKATAKCLAQEGAAVVLCSSNPDNLDKARQDIQQVSGNEVTAIAANLSDQKDVGRLIDRLFEKFDHLDILVNNTGGPAPAQFEELDIDSWRKAYEAMFISAVMLTKSVLPEMKSRQWGRILNITSIAVKQPVENLILSNSIRAGITGFARTLANEVAPFGITVNNILPGFTRTERLVSLAEEAAERNGISTEEAYQAWIKDIPMKRLGAPEEFGSMVTFLASERAAYVTGMSITVDGGWVRSLL